MENERSARIGRLAMQAGSSVGMQSERAVSSQASRQTAAHARATCYATEWRRIRGGSTLPAACGVEFGACSAHRMRVDASRSITPQGGCSMFGFVCVTRLPM